RNLGTGHGLAVGRKDGPLKKRPALEPQDRRAVPQRGERLVWLRVKARVLGEVEVVVRRDFDGIRLFRHTREGPMTLRVGRAGLVADIDPLFGPGVTLFHAHDNHGAGQWLTVLIENATADGRPLFGLEEETVGWCRRGRFLNPASRQGNETVAASRDKNGVLAGRLGKRVLEAG